MASVRPNRWGVSRPAPVVPGGQLGLEEVQSSAQVFTCGCGHLSAEVLCQLLATTGIKAVLDVRELDHSTKRPWFNADALAVTMQQHGLSYAYIGEDREDVDLVMQHIVSSRAPVCLLGVRALVRECPRLALSEQLVQVTGWDMQHLQLTPDAPPSLRLVPLEHKVVFAKQEATLQHIDQLTRQLEAELGLSGSWQERALKRFRVVAWEEWEVDQRWPKADEPPLAIKLPFNTVLVALPGFLGKSEIYKLQRAALPGGIEYQQPRRQVRNPDGSFTSFNEHHKEAWLCNGYEHRDSRRTQAPWVHPGQPLPPWAQDLLQRMSSLLLAPFNSVMCRWEPPGVHLKDGPHTYATHNGWSNVTTIALLALGPTREYRIHAIPWFFGRGRREVVAVHIPLVEGMLVAIGGPLKEKWLYAQPRDDEMLPERIQFTFQLHADLELAKGASSRTERRTEDFDGQLQRAAPDVVEPHPVESPGRSSDSRRRWNRGAR